MSATRYVEWSNPFDGNPNHPIRSHVNMNAAVFSELKKVVDAGAEGSIRFPMSESVAAEIHALNFLATPYFSIAHKKTAAKWLSQANGFNAEGHVINSGGDAITRNEFHSLLKDGLQDALKTDEIRSLLRLDVLDDMATTMKLEASRLVNKDLNANKQPVVPTIIEGRDHPEPVADLTEAKVDAWAKHYAIYLPNGITIDQKRHLLWHAVNHLG